MKTSLNLSWKSFLISEAICPKRKNGKKRAVNSISSDDRDGIVFSKKRGQSRTKFVKEEKAFDSIIDFCSSGEILSNIILSFKEIGLTALSKFVRQIR